MKKREAHSFRDVWRLLPKQIKIQARILVFFMFLASLLEALGIGMIIPFLGSLLSTGINLIPSNGSSIFKFLHWFAIFPLENVVIGLLIVFIIKNLYLGWLTHFQCKLIFRLEASLSNTLLKNYLSRPYDFFVRRNSANLIQNVIGEVSHFCHNAVEPLLGIFSEFLIVMFVLLLLIIVNPCGALIMTFVLAGVGTAFHHQIRLRVARWGKERQHNESMRLQKLQESFGAIKEIKIAGLQPQFCMDYAKYTDASALFGWRQKSLHALPRLMLEMLAVLALVIVVLSVKDSQKAAIIPMLGLYAAAAFRLMPSTNRILTALQAMRFSQSTVIVLTEELTKTEKEEPLPLVPTGLTFKDTWILKDVAFQYSEDVPPVFKTLNLEIRKGEVVCVMGPSGAGKSTLIDVLCGLLSPTAGQVLVDGQDIKGKETLWYRHLAYVPQTIFLIDGTIKENITLGVSPVAVDELWLMDAVKICGLQELVNSHLEGLNASVGERGIKISGGQRQRIGLAREIYRRRDVLVLDEATNALDASMEAEVVKNINRANKKTTVIWITHSDTPLKYADKLITIQEDGVTVKILNGSEKRP
jgi:ABC-type bacteriocin/lantibiotic exporter with double-glycine peptidase domain